MGTPKHGREEPPHIRGQGQKPGPIPEGRRPRGVTPRPRSGAATESARLRRRRKGREELPKSGVRGGGREELPNAPTSEARGGRREDLPHVQRAAAAQAQKGPEELSHIEGQKGRW